MARKTALKRTTSRNALKPIGLQVRDAPTIDSVARAFEAFKDANDKRLGEIEKRGSADVVLREKTDRINDAITRLQDELNKRNKELDDRHTAIEKRADEIEAAAKRAGNPKDDPHADPEYRKHFLNYLKRGDNGIERPALEALEKRAMSAGNSVEGGYVTPIEFDREIAKVARTEGNLRDVATVRSISAGVYKKPISKGDNTSGWVGEKSDRTQTTPTSFALIEIPAHELYANVATTQTLLDDAFINMEQFIAEETYAEFFEQEGAAFITGTGQNQPQGLILPSGRLTEETGTTEAVQGKLGYVKTLSTSAFADGTTIKAADAFINCEARLKAAYRGNARWRFTRFTQAEVRKIKDTTNQYIWQPSIQVGKPNTLLGYPTDVDDFMPAIGSGNLPVLFGDFRRAYTIVDRIGVRILRDPYTAKPYVLFYVTKRVGGGYVLTEALKGIMTAT